MPSLLLSLSTFSLSVHSFHASQRIMPSLLFVALLALASSYGAFGAPSCGHGTTKADCVSKCKAKMGWPGHAMGSHHWGPVAHKTDKDIGDLVTNACNGSTCVPKVLSSSTAPSKTVPFLGLRHPHLVPPNMAPAIVQ